MNHLLKHKGYYGEVYYSDEDECYVGCVLGIKSILAVHENTASETIKELLDSIDYYLHDCEEEGRTPNETDPNVIRELEPYFESISVSDGFYMVPVSNELAVAS